MNHQSLLSLLQLASPALPIGAYSYSEGLETLVETQAITTAADLTDWLTTELRYGSIRLDGAVLVRTYHAIHKAEGQPNPTLDYRAVEYWNRWLSASRETEELRQQNWQMGRTLLKLVQELAISGSDEAARLSALATYCEPDCNVAVAFAIAASSWHIDLPDALLGYLHSWAANLVSAGVRLVPLGQTAGQRLLLDLQPILKDTSQALLSTPDDDLFSCSWGLSLASMNHEVQYSRLFRS